MKQLKHVNRLALQLLQEILNRRPLCRWLQSAPRILVPSFAALTLLSFAERLSCAPPDPKGLRARIEEICGEENWQIQRIRRDFSDYEKRQFSRAAIEGALEKYPYLAGIEIHQGSIRLIPSREPGLRYRESVVTQAFTDLLRYVSLPDALIAFTAHDSLYSTDDLAQPATPDAAICTFGKPAGKQGVLIPDFEALKGYDHLLCEVRNAETSMPWSSKIAKAVWRGSTTGGQFEREIWARLPRARLVQAAQNHPLLIDAKFTAAVQSSNVHWLRQELLRKGLWGQPLKIGDMCRHKYLIDIDGNTCSYSRMYWSLLAESCLLKVRSNNVQWYYGILEPYQHYVPIEAGLEDLPDTFQWLQNHDQEAHQIALNATQLAEQELDQSSCLGFLALVVKEWSVQQRP